MTMFEYSNGVEQHAIKMACNELELPYIDDREGVILVETDTPVEIYAIQDMADQAVCSG